MSDELFSKRQRKEPLQLQLTAMIDVFSMIVIFLIFGTVFGAADIVIPADVKIPKSVSKEGIESAPLVSIVKSEVTMNLVDKPIPIATFHSESGQASLRTKLAPLLKSFQDKQKATKKDAATATSVTPLNFVADQETPYSDIFDVISVFRQLGFNTILFVASGQAAAKNPTGEAGKK